MAKPSHDRARAPVLQPRPIAPGEVLAEAPLPEGSTVTQGERIPGPTPEPPTVPLEDYERLLAARDRLGLRVSELEAALRVREARLSESMAASDRLEAANAALQARVEHLEERRASGLTEIDRLQALADLAATQQTAALHEQRRALNKVHDKALREATDSVERLALRESALLEELRLRGIAPPAGRGSFVALASLVFNGRQIEPGERFDADPGEVASLPPESYSREG